MRSIIQLVILKQLEKNLGMDIALGAFFDLVVGTRLGPAILKIISNMLIDTLIVVLVPW